MYEIEEIEVAFTQATASYHHDITQYLTFTEYRTTTEHHPTKRPSHSLHVSLTDCRTYSPTIERHTDTSYPTPIQPPV